MGQDAVTPRFSVIDGQGSEKELPLRPPRRTHVVLIASQQSGCGKTTLATNLAIATAQRGMKTLLVDADVEGAGVHHLLGLPAQQQRDEDRARVEIYTADSGLLVAPAYGRRREEQNDITRARQLRDLLHRRQGAGVILFDTPTDEPGVLGPLISVAHHVVVVAGADRAAWRPAYALLKRLAKRKRRPEISLLFNPVDSQESLREATQSLEESASRYLRLRTSLLGWVPRDAAIPDAEAHGIPLLLRAPESSAARGIEKAAAKITAAAGPPPPPPAAEQTPAGVAA